MGNALRTHEDLVHIRGWTKEQISTIFDTLRRKQTAYTMTKDEFTRYFGGRNREVITVFKDLDTDRDGKVDVFEVLVAITVWSGTPWDEKLSLLFEIFDMMDKGFLKIDEVMLMGTVLVQTVRKFVKIDPKLSRPATIKELAQHAIPASESKLTPELFRQWVKNCEPLTQLRGHIEDHASRGPADTNESRMQMQISSIEKHASRLFERIEQIQDRLPDFADACLEYVSAWGRRKRWDFLMQNTRQLVLKLQHVSEKMHTMLADLEASLNEDEVSGGMMSITNPARRFSQEQMLIDLELMRQQSQTDFYEGTVLLKRLIELTEPSETQMEHQEVGPLTSITEDAHEGLIDMSPPRVVQNRDAMRQVWADMVADIEEGGIFARMQLADSAEGSGEPGKDAPGALAVRAVQDARENEATLIAVAEFEPPASHVSQMLRLRVGDKVTVLGQDGRGWWYGKLQTGKEGWFPPSYVQVKPAHVTAENR